MKTKSQDNRLLMPECARIVDEFKAVFGPDQVKVVYAAENNIELGKRHYGEPNDLPV